jgi:Myb-like DNA-binding protein FlbD
VINKKKPKKVYFSHYNEEPWNIEEDRKVIELIEKYGPQRWNFIAENIPGRVGKQCRERWHNHLNPNVNKTAWDEEQEFLLYLVIKSIIN